MLHIFASVFRGMLQAFVQNISSVSYVCYSSVLFGCCICFTHMLQVFYLDVAYVSHTFCKCSISTLHMFHTYIIKVCFRCFRGMLQLLHMDVTKVDQDISHVAYFASVLELCYKHLFKMFYLF